MISNERKIELIKELLKDHREQKLSSLAAMVALQLIIEPKKPSKECTEWAMKAFLKYSDNEQCEKFDDWSEETE